MIVYKIYNMPSRNHTYQNIEMNECISKKARMLKDRLISIGKRNVLTGNKINTLIGSTNRSRGSNWFNHYGKKQICLLEHELKLIDEYLDKLSNEYFSKETIAQNNAKSINRSKYMAIYCYENRLRLDLTGSKIADMIGVSSMTGSNWLVSYNDKFPPVILKSHQLDIIEKYIIERERTDRYVDKLVDEICDKK